LSQVHGRAGGRGGWKGGRRRPLTTYNIEDKTHVFKVLIDLAATPAKDSIRLTPALRLRGSRLNVSGDLASREMPDLDMLLIPQHGVDTSILRIESVAIASVGMSRGVKATANVEVADVAVRVALKTRVQAREGRVLDTALGRVS
jgi:hypothetical protein